MSFIMPSEKSLWNSIRKDIETLHPIRIESHFCSGIPDVNIATGWAELKYMPSWPKRDSTPLRIRHYTEQQKAFMKKRFEAGGKCWVILKVGSRDWFIIPYPDCLDLGTLTKSQMKERYQYFNRKPKATNFIELLR